MTMEIEPSCVFYKYICPTQDRRINLAAVEAAIQKYEINKQKHKQYLHPQIKPCTHSRGRDRQFHKITLMGMSNKDYYEIGII